MLRGSSPRLFVSGVACLSLAVSAALAQQPATKGPATKKAATAPAAKAAPAASATRPKYGFFQPTATFKDERDLKEHERLITTGILRGRGAFDQTAQDALKKWFEQKILPEFTIPQNWNHLPERRGELRAYLKGASDPAAATQLKKTILRYMQAFAAARNNYHPAVRYNAMLVIGDLNDFEAGSRDGDRRVSVPDPMVAALDVLDAEFKSTTQSDAVKIAALVGMLRHAQLDYARPAARKLEKAKRIQIVATMYQFLRSSPPPTRTAEGHTWMQRRAIEIMSAYDAVGDVPQVTAELQRIVADESSPRSLRCTAAEALGRWLPDSKVNFDPANLSADLGRIGVEAFETELALISKLQKEEELRAEIRALVSDTSSASRMNSGSTMTGTEGGGAMSEMMQMSAAKGGGAGGDTGADAMQEMPDMGNYSQFFGGGGGGKGADGAEDLILAGPQDPRVTRSRRRLKYQLACIKAGLDGIANVKAVEAQKAEIDKVLTAITSAYKTTDPPRGDLPSLEQSLKQGLGMLAFLRPAGAGLEDPSGLEAPGTPGPPAPGPPAPGAPTPAPSVPGGEAVPAEPAAAAPPAPGEEAAPAEAAPPAP